MVRSVGEPAVVRGRSLRLLTTLRAGGDAEYFAAAHSADDLARLVEWSVDRRMPFTVLGSGSNVLPSDAGVPGLVIHNRAKAVAIDIESGVMEAETGAAFQDVFLAAAQAGLSGLEFAVGIPGTLGGALVSNAGAYRSNISSLLTELDVATPDGREWLSPSWMEFDYRTSILREPNPPPAVVCRVRMRLRHRPRHEIFEEAREFQRQRIRKQPPPASAGSFFKNVNDPVMAVQLADLPEPLRLAGIIPAGFLIQKAGLAGVRHRGAAFSHRHANFLMNVGRAQASAIRSLADHVKYSVKDHFGVLLEEEVLYLGNWSRYRPEPVKPNFD